MSGWESAFGGGPGALSETDLSLAMIGFAHWKRPRELPQPDYYIVRDEVAVPSPRSSSRRWLGWQSAR